jgi:hypothetical protein
MNDLQNYKRRSIPRYTSPMSLPVILAERLRVEVRRASDEFSTGGDAATARRPLPHKWCAREILGHLIDSAANNHRRFIQGQSDESKTYEGYAQDEWVARGRYADAPWSDLLTLWRAYNLQLARVIEAMPEETLQSERMRFLVEDYVRHMRHHLEQIRELLR